MAEVKIPQAFTFTWDIIEAIRSLGGSGSIQEINDAVVQRRKLTEEQQAVAHSDGRTEIEYRLAWARTLAKNLGLVVNSARGVWAVTPLGAAATQDEVEELKRGRDRGRGARQRAELASAAEAGVGPVDASEVIDPGDVEEGADSPTDWREELLAVVKAMDPGAFERLAQRLLREAGFTSVVVMGKSGDGGIDGRGVYRVSPLLSFPAYFNASGTRAAWVLARSATSVEP